MAEYYLKKITDDKLWDESVDSSRQGTIYLRSDFIRSLGVRHSDYLVYLGDRPMAGCTVLEDESGGVLKTACPFVPYQGFFFVNNEQRNYKRIRTEFDLTEYLIRELLNVYRGLSQLHYALDDFRPFLWHNYHSPEKGRFKIDLSYTGLLYLDTFNNLDDLLLSIRTCRRQEYRKAIKNNILVEESGDVQVLDHLHELTFLRQNLTRDEMEKSLLHSISTSAIERGYGELKIAFIDGKPASVALILYHNKRAYYMFGATDPGCRDSGAMTLLLVESIWEAKKQGYKEFDFVGVNSPNRGDYKLSYNGKLIPCFKTQLFLSEDTK